MPINFHELIDGGGVEGARFKFERLIIQLAHLKHKAMGVAANPGDWGIDALFGELDGVIAVWQSKFFPDEIGESQKKQIRDSFTAVIKAAEDHGHEVGAWTLCVATDLDPEAQKWWDTWKRKQECDHDLAIDLWGATRLEGMLLAPEAIHLARHFFPASMGSGPVAPAPAVLPLPEDHEYDDALFVRQLKAADVVETESAKRQFFNYEALARDVADKADPIERQTLEAVEAEVHAIWEIRFAAASPDPQTGKDPALVPGVMEAIRDHHAGSPPTLPPMSFIHQMGTMHRVVENGNAGWVARFRQLAEAYRA